MERVAIAEGLQFSRVVYGLWRLADDTDTTPKHVQAKIEACLAQGITTLDHADIYGGYQGEEVFGAALKSAPHLRDQIEIVTKCDIVAPVGRYSSQRVKHYDTSAKHIEASVESSLRLMGIERIDLLLIHRPDPLMDPFETGATLDRLVTSGKVRTLGASNFHPRDWDLLQSAMDQPLRTNQIEMSLMATECFTNGDLAHLQLNGVPPMAWSPLGGGALLNAAGRLGEVLDRIANEQGVDRAAVATAWLLAHPATVLPVMGTNNLTRIATLSDATKVAMDRQTWFELLEAARGQEVP
jgi:predicted oxidoreductase